LNLEGHLRKAFRRAAAQAKAKGPAESYCVFEELAKSNALRQKAAEARRQAEVAAEECLGADDGDDPVSEWTWRHWSAGGVVSVAFAGILACLSMGGEAYWWSVLLMLVGLTGVLVLSRALKAPAPANVLVAAADPKASSAGGGVRAKNRQAAKAARGRNHHPGSESTARKPRAAKRAADAAAKATATASKKAVRACAAASELWRRAKERLYVSERKKARARRASGGSGNAMLDAMGLGDRDPANSAWLPLTRRKDGADVETVGELLVSIELLPNALAQTLEAGSGRSEPNTNPELPPPVGRFDPSKALDPLCEKGFELEDIDVHGPYLRNKIDLPKTQFFRLFFTSVL
jgi:hypothetical protein